MGLNIQNVVFKYAKKAPKNTINNVNLTINDKNEFIAILGHTGSGKSTLVQLMNALLIPTSGTVTVNEQTVTSSERENKKIKFKLIRQHIGLVFQFPEYQLFEDSVINDIMFGPKNFGKTEEEAKKEALKVASILRIAPNILDRSPFSLSGGQMRKVAIAGILASNPDILILDEPTVGLDPRGKIELMKLLQEIQAETQKTIIMISHDMNVVAEYAKRIIVMNQGNVVFDGEKRSLFEDLDNLSSFNLDLPECAKIALELKNRGLIKFNQLPLTKDELYKVLVDACKVGDSNE